MALQRPSGGFGPMPALALPLAGLLLVAARRAPPLGELVLDADAPVVAATLGGVAMRLRVTPAAQAAIDLAPAAAARLALRWEAAAPIDVGRVRLDGRAAATDLVIGGVTVPVQVEDHGRTPAADADGEVAPGVLPFATVAWRRAAAPVPTSTVSVALTFDPAFGYSAATGAAGVVLRFDPAQATSSATAAAGARLARRWGGDWAGAPYPAPGAFGVARIVRRLAFARPGLLAGFSIAALPVRLADFGGHDALPTDPPRPDDVVVRHRLAPQRGWPAVTLGADRLDRCRELLFTAQPRTLTLRCAP